MIVAHVWDAEYPWDVRVEKISRALVANGHRLHILARNRDGRPAREDFPEGTVHRMPSWSAVGPRVDAATQFPAFFNPRWIRFLDRTIRTERADVVVCRDLPLAPTAVHVARGRGIPMVFDMAENYPAMIADLWRFGRPRPFDGLVRNPAMARMIERWVVRRADHVLVVVEESRRRLIAEGVAPERVSVVSNTPPRSQLAAPRPDPERQGVGVGVGEPLDLVYVGQLDSPMRGLGGVLEAVAACRGRGASVRATFIGDGRERPVLIDQARSHGLDEDVARFPGRLPHGEALAMLPRFHVGVVPHLATDHSDTTVANKLFDYMAAGLAVLTSNAKPLARIVAETGAGEVYASGDPVDLARGIERLLDPGRRRRAAAAGWDAVATTYHWERDVERLEHALSGLAREPLERLAATTTGRLT